MKKIVAKTGTYTKDGEEKNLWTVVGRILSNDNGEYVILDAAVNLGGIAMKQRIMNPKSKGDVMCSIFTDEPKQAQQKPAASDDFDDDIPF